MEIPINEPVTITPAQISAEIDIEVSAFVSYAEANPPQVPGLTLNSDKLTGTPTQTGTWRFLVTDYYGEYPWELTVLNPNPAESNPEPPAEENPMPPGPFPGDLPPTVLAFMGIPETPETLALARQHVRVVTTFVRAYTRGKGFDKLSGTPGIDIEDVIVSAAARYLVNPQQLSRQTLGNQSVSYAALEGFTLAEKAVLNQYRRRAS